MNKMRINVKLLHNILLIAFFGLLLGEGVQDKDTRKGVKESPAISQTEEINKKLSEANLEEIRLVKMKDGNKLYVEFYATGFFSYKKSSVAFQISKVLKSLKEMNLNKEQYEIVAIGKDLVDKYGNKSEEALISAVFSQQTVNKINFQNIRQRDILELADNVSIYFNMDE